jgi:hypothetical protein
LLQKLFTDSSQTGHARAEVRSRHVGVHPLE